MSVKGYRTERRGYSENVHYAHIDAHIDDRIAPPDRTLGAFNALVQSGKVRQYHAPTHRGVGARAVAALGPLVELGACSLVSEGPYGTVVGGELKLHPELGGLTELNLETEYGLHTDTGARGLRLGGAAKADGSFAFPAVPEGGHVLVLGAAAARPAALTVPALPYRVEVRAGEMVVAKFREVRPAQVRGRVRFVQPQEKAAKDTQAEPGSAIIFGEGRPEQEGGLIENLVVELTDGDTILRARTDAEGRFRFELLPPGKWRLTVLRGSLPELYRLEPETRFLTIAPGTAARVEVKLVPVARSIQFDDGGTLSTP